MKAMAVTEYGHPLQPLDVDEPALRPGHALLEVLSCGICFSDVKTIRGRMPFSGTLPLPHIPGHEICGRVLQTDPPGAVPQDRLYSVYLIVPCRMCARCRAGDEQICLNVQRWIGFRDPGGLQERVVVPLDRLLEVPAGLSPVDAAPLSCALGTAFRAVVTRGGAGPGVSMAVVGLGGVGIHALQIAAATGATAVGVDISARAREGAAALGLEAFAPDDPQLSDWICTQTRGDGLDAVVDTVGRTDSVAAAFDLVRRGGRIVGIGYGVDQFVHVPTARWALDEIALLGSRFATRDDLRRAARLIERGAVRPVVSMVRDLAQANDIIEGLERGSVMGRGAVLMPAAEAAMR